MLDRLRVLARAVSAYVRAQVASWRTGSVASQVYVLGVLLLGVAVSLLITWYDYAWMPLTSYFVWLLIGMLLLRFVPLAVLAVVVTLGAILGMLHDGPITGPRVSASISLVISSALIVYQASRQRSGLPVPLSEALLSELRDRLQRQGRVPDLPAGWTAQSAMIAAHGAGYAGDFLVAELREGRRLEMVLVDVCGKGPAVGPQALQFAGALGGLLGALPPAALMNAANEFLLRQDSDETFSTAVHVIADLETGDYTITSAGHPPALHWQGHESRWAIDNARGMALGVLPDPDLDSSSGRLEPGDALLFYTDGVIESRDQDLQVGIDWLRGAAAAAVGTGFDGAARRIVKQVARGDDDRAVLMLAREPGVHPAAAPQTVRPLLRDVSRSAG